MDMTTYEQWLFREALGMADKSKGAYLIAFLLRHHAITDRNPQAWDIIFKKPVDMNDRASVWKRILDAAEDLYGRGEKLNKPKKRSRTVNKKKR